MHGPRQITARITPCWWTVPALQMAGVRGKLLIDLVTNRGFTVRVG